jgi:hypothetical protein
MWLRMVAEDDGHGEVEVAEGQLFLAVLEPLG